MNSNHDRGTSAIATSSDISLAYELVLGRAPDETGLAYFSSLARSQNLNRHEVAKLLINSDEGRGKNAGEQEPIEIRLGNYHVYVRPSDRDIGGAIARGIEYEPHVTALVRRELRSGDTFLDVGANIGYFTMLAASIVGPQGRVLAVEPMDKNLQLIYRGVEKNALSNVEVFPFGASSESGVVAIVTDPSTSNALVQSAPSSRSASVFAPVRTLDWMCRGLERLDFLKMDIEGHEVFAWRGARDLLARFRPRIATEFHPYAMRENAGLDCSEYLDLLFDYADEIEVLVSAETVRYCATPAEVMREWHESDRRHGGRGTSHLDLFVRPTKQNPTP